MTMLKRQPNPEQFVTGLLMLVVMLIGVMCVAWAAVQILRTP